jgi:hypothetical protein
MRTHLRCAKDFAEGYSTVRYDHDAGESHRVEHMVDVWEITYMRVYTYWDSTSLHSTGRLGSELD